MRRSHLFSRGRALLAVLSLCGLLPAVAAAHEPGMVELRLDTTTDTLRVEIDLIDLDYLIGLDGDADGYVSAAEIGASRFRISRHVARGLAIDGCRIDPSLSHTGLRRDATPSVVVDYSLQCETAKELTIASTVFDELPDYRTVLFLETGGEPRAFVLGADKLSIAPDETGAPAGFGTFLREGVIHILIGIDHLAFLLVLVLPLATRGSWPLRLRATAGLVTAFTIAHSITLSLSAMGQLALPARPVELAIAASVVVAALLNLFAGRSLHRWPLAYAFGLIHGFGFAGALGELAIADGLRVGTLLAFNLGVELGQLLVVAIALPILALLARMDALGRVLVPAGSLAVASLGILWLVERF